MSRDWLRLILAFVATGVGTAAPAQFSSPDAKVFARAEDRVRARLLKKPCTEADVGRSCYRFDSFLLREAPCAYHIDAGTIGVIPTDQCYKMDVPRRYRGVWLDQFEGQQFIPEETEEPERARSNPNLRGRRKQIDQGRSAAIWLEVERVNLGHDWRHGVRRVFLEFVGRKTLYSGNHGHLGMWGHELVVDRVLSLKECPETGECR
jgi:Zn-finger nucleic acid-binding protein